MCDGRCLRREGGWDVASYDALWTPEAPSGPNQHTPGGEHTEQRDAPAQLTGLGRKLLGIDDW